MRIVEDPAELEKLLPPGQTVLTVRQLSQVLKVSIQHVHNLLEDEEFDVAPDMSRKNTKKALVRVTRSSVLTFLLRRGQRRNVRPLSASKSGVPLAS